MKNTFTIIGAIAVALALVAAVVVFVKKYTVSFSIRKNEDAELPGEDDIYSFDDLDWEEVPVEEDEELEDASELDSLDADDKISF